MTTTINEVTINGMKFIVLDGNQTHASSLTYSEAVAKSKGETVNSTT